MTNTQKYVLMMLAAGNWLIEIWVDARKTWMLIDAIEKTPVVVKPFIDMDALKRLGYITDYNESDQNHTSSWTLSDAGRQMVQEIMA